MASFLIVAPADPGTPVALAPVAQALANRCPSRHTVSLLYGYAADRTAVDGLLPNHMVVIYLGHGDEDWLGPIGSPLIDAGNVQHVQQVLVAIACKASRKLGLNHFGASTTRVFLGFNTFMAHPAKAVTRANDVYEHTLADFMSGKSIGDVKNDLYREFQQAAADYLVNRQSLGISDGEALIFFWGLRSNCVALECHGNSQLVV